MKIVFFTFGTHGDLEPFVALGLALKKAGHYPLIVGPKNFEGFTRRASLEFYPIPVDSKDIMNSDDGLELIRQGDSAKFLRQTSIMLKRFYTLMEDHYLQAAHDSDLIVGGALTVKDALCVSDKLNIPACIVSLFPAFPATGDIANLYVSRRDLRWKFLNRCTHKLFDQIYWQEQKGHVDALRARWSLSPMRGPLFSELARRQISVIHAYSKALLPPCPDWQESGHWSGFLPISYEDKAKLYDKPMQSLHSILKSKKKPIVFSFGSMPVLKSDALLKLISEVLTELEEWGILVSSWSQQQPQQSYDNLLIIPSICLEWLFQRCSTVVHHGGAGTTHTALMAGVPSVIYACFGDQFFWADRINKLQCGVGLAFKNLNHQTLHAALKKTKANPFKCNPAEISKAIKEEIDFQRTIAFLEAYLENCKSKSRTKAI